MIDNLTPELCPVYECDSAAARKLADVGAISQDLGRVFSFVTRLIDESDLVLQDALFVAALITYRRCFNSGTRLVLSSSDVVGLAPDADEIHSYYMAMAGKFAAHSVNSFEQMKAGIFVRNEIIGVGVFSIRLITFDRDGLCHWARLINLIKNKIAEVGRQMEAELLAEAQVLSVEEIARSPKIVLSGGANPAKRR